MATTTNGLVRMDVMDYATGDQLGTVEATRALADLYARCQSRQFQWPEGTALAGDVCPDGSGRSIADLLGIDDGRVIWLD
jgi:hypothetical protein